jgi:hypothetical protein
MRWLCWPVVLAGYVLARVLWPGTEEERKAREARRSAQTRYDMGDRQREHEGVM